MEELLTSILVLAALIVGSAAGLGSDKTGAAFPASRQPLLDLLELELIETWSYCCAALAWQSHDNGPRTYAARTAYLV